MTAPSRILVISALIIALPVLAGACSSSAKKPDAPAGAAAANAMTQAATKAAVATAKKAVGVPAAGKVVCKLDSDERTIEVTPMNDGCEVAYTKFGKTANVASSANGTHHCEEVLDHIKQHLGSSGFVCH